MSKNLSDPIRREDHRSLIIAECFIDFQWKRFRFTHTPSYLSLALTRGEMKFHREIRNTQIYTARRVEISAFATRELAASVRRSRVLFGFAKRIDNLGTVVIHEENRDFLEKFASRKIDRHSALSYFPLSFHSNCSYLMS